MYPANNRSQQFKGKSRNYFTTLRSEDKEELVAFDVNELDVLSFLSDSKIIDRSTYEEWFLQTFSFFRE
jgi:hypothetical protein